MKKLILLIISVYTLNVFSVETPILKQTSLFRANLSILNGDTKEKLKSIGETLNQNQIYWFGYPWMKLDEHFLYCQGFSCQVQALFTADGFSAEELIKQQLKDHGFKIDGFISNQQGTFYAISTAILGTHKDLRCYPKSLNKISQWSNTLEQSNLVAQGLNSKSYAEKIEWIKANLKCNEADIQSVGTIKEMRLIIELANRSVCPITAENLNKCLLGTLSTNNVVKF